MPTGARIAPVSTLHVLAAFPVLSETFINSELRALERLGWRVRVEAVARPSRPLMDAMRGLTVNFLEDEGTLDRLRAAGWLACRHPVRCR